MKLKNSRSIWKVAGVLLSATILTTLFQNCGKAGFDSGLDEQDLSSTDLDLSGRFGKSDAEKVRAAPFAFETSINQIAYNSCPANSNVSDGFTFKVGAYGTEGTRLNQSFLNYIKLKFDPLYGAKSLSVNQIKNILSNSPENKAARPQISLRAMGRPQEILTNVKEVNLLQDLTDDRFMDTIVRSSPDAVNYFRYAISDEERSLEAKLVDESKTGPLLRRGFKDSFRLNNVAIPHYQLTLAYTDKDSGMYGVKAPANSKDSTKAYGRGYELAFVSFPRPYRSDSPNNQLAQVTEKNLETGSVISSPWNCRPYTIVVEADRGTHCPIEDRGKMEPEEVKELGVLRRQLYANEWDINVKWKCVVPKEKSQQSSCYREYDRKLLPKGSVAISYNVLRPCFDPEVGASEHGSGTANLCPQHISICTRN